MVRLEPTATVDTIATAAVETVGLERVGNPKELVTHRMHPLMDIHLVRRMDTLSVATGATRTVGLEEVLGLSTKVLAEEVTLAVPVHVMGMVVVVAEEAGTKKTEIWLLKMRNGNQSRYQHPLVQMAKRTDGWRSNHLWN